MNILNPDDCVLLVIDCQENWKAGMGEFADLLVPKIASFSEEVRRWNIPTLWAVWPEIRRDKRNERKEGKILPYASAGDILGEADGLLCGQEGDYVVPKYSLSAFSNRRLARFITQKLGRHTVLVGGVFRGACVAATLEDKKEDASLSFVPLVDMICSQIVGHYGDRKTNIRLGDHQHLIEDNRAYYARLVKAGAYDSARFAVSFRDNVLENFEARTQEKRPLFTAASSLQSLSIA